MASSSSPSKGGSELVNTQPVTPSLTVPNCAEALKWYKSALGATEAELFMDKTKVMHSMLRFPNGAFIYFTDDFPAKQGNMSRLTHLSAKNPPPFNVNLQFNDETKANAFWRDCIKANTDTLRIDMEFAVQCWGYKYGEFTDPFGLAWCIFVRDKNLDVAKAAVSSSTSAKKRTLSTAKTTDGVGDDGTIGIPSKRTKTAADAIEYHIVDATELPVLDWDSLRKTVTNASGKAVGETMGDGELNVVNLGLMALRSPMTGIGIHFRVGLSTGVSFENAACDGFPALFAAAQSHGKSLLNPPICLSPENPDTHDPVRYTPALLWNAGEDLSKMIGSVVGKGAKSGLDLKLSKIGLETGVVLTVLYTGDFSGLGAAWKQAMGVVLASGYELLPELCFEACWTNPEETAPEKLKTTIHIGVKSMTAATGANI